MFQALKKALLPLAFLALIVGGGAMFQAPKAHAALDPERIWFLDGYGDPGDTTCAAGTDRRLTMYHLPTNVRSATAEDGDIVELPSDGVLLCVQPIEGAGNVTLTSFDSVGHPRGDWSLPVCGSLDVDDDANLCVGVTLNAGGGVVPDAPAPDNNDLDLLAVYFDCSSDLPLTLRISQPAASSVELTVYCGPPSAVNLTITPTTVESNPAPFSTAHSLIRAEITTSTGGPVLPNTQVDLSVDRCLLSDGITDQATRDEAFDLFDTPPLPNYIVLDDFANSFPATLQSLTLTAFDIDANDDGYPDHSEVLAILHAEGCDPGPVAVTLSLNLAGTTDDIEETGTITVVGPPAFITVTASPTEVICGEKSEITVSVTDALNQGVSDNTRIEVITNHGGVLAGTGTSLTTNQPVNPLSSTTVEIFDGRGIAYLLTSPEHHGPYEVLAASTPSQFGNSTIETSAPVSAQVTVTCTLATAPDVTPPDTGTGTIKPPNTGDAGLAGGFGSSASLLVVAGATILAMAGIVRLRFSRA